MSEVYVIELPGGDMYPGQFTDLREACVEKGKIVSDLAEDLLDAERLFGHVKIHRREVHELD